MVTDLRKGVWDLTRPVSWGWKRFIPVSLGIRSTVVTLSAGAHAHGAAVPQCRGATAKGWNAGPPVNCLPNGVGISNERPGLGRTAMVIPVEISGIF